MNWIRSIVREVIGLFVDDGSFAALIVLWIALVWVSRHYLQVPTSGGAILFLGLGLILIGSVIRFSRRRSG